eukprot:4346732-Alexandrium_andersonii.AAC.1
MQLGPARPCMSWATLCTAWPRPQAKPNQARPFLASPAAKPGQAKAWSKCHRRNLKDTPQRPPNRTTVLKPQAHLGQQGPSQGLRRPEVLGRVQKRPCDPMACFELRAP